MELEGLDRVHTGASDTAIHTKAAMAGLTPRAAQATACGKAIIVGEHAVVYGARAVAMPLQALHMSVRLAPADRAPERPRHQLRFGGRQVTRHLAGMVDDACRVLGIDSFPVDLNGSSSVPIGAGLGSSAALCIVMLRALSKAVGLPMSCERLAAAGNQLERRFHGNPSGLDTTVVAYEETVLFARGESPKRFRVNTRNERAGERSAQGNRWVFALLDSGARSSTLAMIERAAPYFAAPAGDERLAKFDALATAVRDGLECGDVQIVATAMREAGAMLDEAGVVSPRLHEVIGIALKAGARAAKTTGAGGGGCVMALLDYETADQQLRLLRSALGQGHVYRVDLT